MGIHVILHKDLILLKLFGTDDQSLNQNKIDIKNQKTRLIKIVLMVSRYGLYQPKISPTC